ncbi:MAG: helix-turn-helix transcriptional regulator [Victivallales bacterium]|nr:helix-turn-helix transcriptional regulator [Victivallales bacterium]
MEWINYDIEKIARCGTFPFQVKMLYFSHRQSCVAEFRTTESDMLEICIRLEPHGRVCHDIINGHPIRECIPHIVWKKPGGSHRFFTDQGARTAIAFGYPTATIAEFKKLGLYPEGDCQPICMTSTIQSLIDDFHRQCLQMHSPGIADQIDWTCFQLYRELLYSRLLTNDSPGDTDKLRNISIWLQRNYADAHDLDALARSNGFSHASFFRKWKQLFHLTPVQYILNLKITEAARLLVETDMPVQDIVREINFSGSTAFHRRFMLRFGMTPMQYRATRNADASALFIGAHSQNEHEDK